MIDLILLNKEKPETGMWCNLTGGSINGTDVILYPETIHTLCDILKAKRIAKYNWDCLKFYTVRLSDKQQALLYKKIYKHLQRN